MPFSPGGYCGARRPARTIEQEGERALTLAVQGTLREADEANLVLLDDGATRRLG
jgi:hypothetical protein